jgi:hypothetical protein
MDTMREHVERMTENRIPKLTLNIDWEEKEKLVAIREEALLKNYSNGARPGH